MPRRGEPGGEHEPSSEVEQAKRDLSIDDIRGAADELEKKVAAARQAKEADIERKVSEHDQLSTQILSLRELLGEAQNTRDYFITVKQAGELPAESEGPLREIEATVAGLEAQIAEAGRRINLYGTQPEILDRIHEAAVSMRDGEIKEAAMKNGIESLTKENDSLAAEVNALAQELRETLEEHQQVTSEYEGLARAINDLRKRALSAAGELVYPKHGKTLHLLNSSEGIPTLEQVQQRRDQLGMFQGKEKAALDIVLQHPDELRRYHELRDRQKLLHDKIWKELREQKKGQLKERITKHMIQAWELHEQTGIEPMSWGGVHAPEIVFRDLEAKVKVLSGIKLVDKSEIDTYTGAQRTVKVEKIENDTPTKKATRDFWNELQSSPDNISYTYYSKPNVKQEAH